MARDTDRRNAAAQARLAERGIHVERQGAEYKWRKVIGEDRGLRGPIMRGHAPRGKGIQELRRAGAQIPKYGPATTKNVPGGGGGGAGQPHPVGPLAPIREAPDGTHGTFTTGGPMTLRGALNTVTRDEALKRLSQLGMVHIVEVYDDDGRFEGYEIVVDDVTPTGGAA